MGGPRRASRLLVRVNRHLLASVLLTGNTICSITNQRETTVAWHKTTGNPLCNAIVWDDSRTKNVVAHFQQKLETVGLQVEPGVWKKGEEGVETLRQTCVSRFFFQYFVLIRIHRTGLPLSTYFSAIKLRWMIDHIPEVSEAHESDQLLFGTVESWLFYVSLQASIVLYY